MVEVLVGSAKDKFVLHKVLLCKAFPNFDGMFNGNLKESETKACSDEDADLLGFELFTHYAYAGELPRDIRSGGTNDRDTERIIKFYVLADKYVKGDHAKEEAMTALLHMNQSLKLTSVAAHTSLLSLNTVDPMGRLVIDLICRDYIREEVDDKWLGEALEGVSVAQMMELFRILKKSGCNGSAEVSNTIKLAKKAGVAGPGRYSKKEWSVRKGDRLVSWKRDGLLISQH